LIAHRNQQRCNVLAVMARLLERRAATLGRYTVAAQLNGGLIRIGVRSFDAGSRVGLVDLEVTNDLALFVVQTAKKCSRSEQATKASIREGGQSTGNG
jgi:hypothetical protein